MGLAEANMALWTCHTLPSTTTLASVNSSSVKHVGDVCSNVETGTAKVRRLPAWCHRLLPDALNACCCLLIWSIWAGVELWL